MQNALKRPADSADSINANLAIQERQKAKAIRRLRRLREKASTEIDRLISFLDASDEYVQAELEEGADDGPCDDTELEPSTGYDEGWESAENDDEAEPSLGWTVDGCLGGHRDLEEEAS